MPDRTVANILQQVAKCRRLAGLLTDPRASKALRDMADELEKDAKSLVERLSVERSREDNKEPPLESGSESPRSKK